MTSPMLTVRSSVPGLGTILAVPQDTSSRVAGGRRRLLAIASCKSSSKKSAFWIRLWNFRDAGCRALQAIWRLKNPKTRRRSAGENGGVLKPTKTLHASSREKSRVKVKPDKRSYSVCKARMGAGMSERVGFMSRNRGRFSGFPPSVFFPTRRHSEFLPHSPHDNKQAAF